MRWPLSGYWTNERCEMNKDNAKDYLPLVQALADGKTIQYEEDSDGNWSSLTNMHFYDDVKYRIKPEPREYWLATSGRFTLSDKEYESGKWTKNGVIKVREVIE